MLRNTLIAIALLYTTATQAQVALAYYPFQSLVSVSSDPDKGFWGDYRIATNTAFRNMDMELAGMWNFERKQRSNLYLGAGIAFNLANPSSEQPLLDGYLVYLGIRYKPLADRNWHVIFELAPYFQRRFDGGSLRSRLGVSYRFGA